MISKGEIKDEINPANNGHQGMIELTKTKSSSSTSNTCPKVTHKVISACSSRRKEWNYEVLSSLRPARENRKAAAFWNSVLRKIKEGVLTWMGKNAKAILWAFPIQTRGDLFVTIITEISCPARPKATRPSKVKHVELAWAYLAIN